MSLREMSAEELVEFQKAYAKNKKSPEELFDENRQMAVQIEVLNDQLHQANTARDEHHAALTELRHAIRRSGPEGWHPLRERLQKEGHFGLEGEQSHLKKKPTKKTAKAKGKK